MDHYLLLKVQPLVTFKLHCQNFKCQSFSLQLYLQPYVLPILIIRTKFFRRERGVPSLRRIIVGYYPAYLHSVALLSDVIWPALLCRNFVVYYLTCLRSVVLLWDIIWPALVSPSTSPLSRSMRPFSLPSLCWNLQEMILEVFFEYLKKLPNTSSRWYGFPKQQRKQLSPFGLEFLVLLRQRCIRTG